MKITDNKIKTITKSEPKNKSFGSDFVALKNLIENSNKPTRIYSPNKLRDQKSCQKYKKKVLLISGKSSLHKFPSLSLLAHQTELHIFFCYNLN